MANSIPIPNAMWWVHYRLGGGGPKLLAFGVVWITLMVAGVKAYRYFDSDTPDSTFCDGAIYVLAGIQVILLIPGGQSLF